MSYVVESEEPLLETDPTRMCELLVFLPDVNFNGVGNWPLWLLVVISTRALRPSCPSCAGTVRRHGIDEVELADLPCFGRRTRLVWVKQRWRCPNALCRVVTFVETDERIAADQAAITDRAGRWATFQVGLHGRSVSEVADDLGCDWHTVIGQIISRRSCLIGRPMSPGGQYGATRSAIDSHSKFDKSPPTDCHVLLLSEPTVSINENYQTGPSTPWQYVNPAGQLSRQPLTSVNGS